MIEITDVADAESDQISKTDFTRLLQQPEAARALSQIVVDVVGLVDFTDFLFVGGTILSFGEFIDRFAASGHERGNRQGCRGSP